MDKKQIIILIFFIAGLMMLGSLYIENFGDPLKNLMQGILFPLNAGFPPCTLCRYERITMYPIVVLILSAWYFKAQDVEKYILPLACIGLIFCCYHSALQWGRFPAPTVCTTNAPCDYPVINYFGWITLPFLGVICNGIIVTLLVKKD